MSVDVSSVRSRRAVLAGLFGGLAAVAAQAARPLTAAAEGEHIVVGGDYTTATSRTFLKNDTSDADVLVVVTSGAGKALWGKSTTGIGVYAQSVLGNALRAESDPGPAVVAISTKGRAVDARSVKGEAVHAQTVQGIAVVAVNESSGTKAILAADDVGVTAFGNTTGIVGFGDTGIIGSGDVGVHGTGKIAIRARAVADGLALQISGPASFMRSGVASVPAGKDRVNISVPSTNFYPITAKSFALATLNVYRAGVRVDAAVCHPDAQTVTIRLNSTVNDDTPVGWMVLEQFSPS